MDWLIFFGLLICVIFLGLLIGDPTSNNTFRRLYGVISWSALMYSFVLGLPILGIYKLFTREKKEEPTTEEIAPKETEITIQRYVEERREEIDYLLYTYEDICEIIECWIEDINEDLKEEKENFVYYSFEEYYIYNLADLEDYYSIESIKRELKLFEGVYNGEIKYIEFAENYLRTIGVTLSKEEREELRELEIKYSNTLAEYIVTCEKFNKNGYGE